MVKPNFLIVGAMKSATTTLAKLLNQHPDVYCAPEIHYFYKNYKKGSAWYESHFKKAKAVGEKTPAYMFIPECAKRIRDYNKDIKLIFILRNPINMVYSFYWHSYKDGAEKRTFEEVIQREEKGIEKDITYCYAKRGKYVEQIKRFLKYFKKEQMHFIILEEFKKNPEKLGELCDFLGVKRYRPILSRSNITKMPRSMRLQRLLWKKKGRIADILRYINIQIGTRGYPKMDNTMKKHLVEKFKPANQELSKIIGRDVAEFWN